MRKEGEGERKRGTLLQREHKHRATLTEYSVDVGLARKLPAYFFYKPIHGSWVAEIPEWSRHIVGFPANFTLLVVQEHLRIARVVKRGGGYGPIVWTRSAAAAAHRACAASDPW